MYSENVTGVLGLYAYACRMHVKRSFCNGNCWSRMCCSVRDRGSAYLRGILSLMCSCRCLESVSMYGCIYAYTYMHSHTYAVSAGLRADFHIYAHAARIYTVHAPTSSSCFVQGRRSQVHISGLSHTYVHSKKHTIHTPTSSRCFCRVARAKFTSSNFCV